MRGRVVFGGRAAVVPLPVLASGGTCVEVETMIDTGFTGHLTLPADVVQSLALSGRRSEEHTSELQSRQYLVCRLLLEKKTHDQDNQDSVAHEMRRNSDVEAHYL